MKRHCFLCNRAKIPFPGKYSVRILSALWYCCIPLLCPAADPADENRKEKIMHAELGHRLDLGFYNAGKILDRIRLTCKDPKIRAEAEIQDQALRGAWRTLEEKRAGIEKKLEFAKDPDDYFLSIENLEPNRGSAINWVGFRKIELSGKEGWKHVIPLQKFANVRFIRKYDYNCQPAAAIFVSAGKTAVSDCMPGDLSPAGNHLKLHLSGLDCDKAEPPVRIRIRIFGREIFHGPVPFRKKDWSDQVLSIPGKFLAPQREARRHSVKMELESLRKEVDAFADTGRKQSGTLLLRAGRAGCLPLPPPEKRSGNRFLLALEVEDCRYSESRFRYPGQAVELETAALLCRELNLDFVTLNVLRSGLKDHSAIIRPFAENTGIPFLLWGSNRFFRDRDIVSPAYLFDRKALLHDLDAFLAVYRNLPHFRGIYLDEPNLRLGSLPCQELEKNPAYQKAAGGRSGIEYEKWKAGLLAEHIRFLEDQIALRGFSAHTVIMNLNTSGPQGGSYVSFGALLRNISTDLYNNGTQEEAFAIQLLKHAAGKRAWMTPGAGYSCYTPEAWQRSLAIGITYADGIHVWGSLFCFKYRDANYFWRYGGTRDETDDKGRPLRRNWHPDYWYVMRDTFRIVRKHAEVLGGRQSIAETALAVSEEALMRAALQRNAVELWQRMLQLYRKACGNGRAVDVLYQENLTADRLARYRTIINGTPGTVCPALAQWRDKGGFLCDFPAQALPEDNLPIRVSGLPENVTVTIQRSVEDDVRIVSLIDYEENRTVAGHSLKHSLPTRF